MQTKELQSKEFQPKDSQDGPLLNPLRVIPIAIATLAAFFVAFMGATATDLGPWYQSLTKPIWTAPDGLFPIVWTVIFAMITVAGINAWRAAPTSREARSILSLFATNALLNISWSLLFFRLQRPDWAFVELGFLWISILLMIVSSVRYSRSAAAMLLPYLMWISYAGMLNWAIVRLNGPFG